MSVKVSTQRTFKALLILISSITLVSLGSYALGALLPEDYENWPIKLLSVDSELSVATLYAVLMLQVCALLLLVISYLVKITQGRFLGHWIVLSLAFWYISLDEAASLHEKTIVPMRELIGNPDGFLYFAWVIPAGVVVTLFFISYLPFLKALPGKIRNLFLTAGGLFVLGAMGWELIGGKIFNSGLPRAVYVLSVHTEEFLEMLGVILFVYALLSYIKMFLSKVEISLSK